MWKSSRAMNTFASLCVFDCTRYSVNHLTQLSETISVGLRSSVGAPPLVSGAVVMKTEFRNLDEQRFPRQHTAQAPTRSFSPWWSQSDHQWWSPCSWELLGLWLLSSDPCSTFTMSFFACFHQLCNSVGPFNGRQLDQFHA